jgi:hypothetical protein
MPSTKQFRYERRNQRLAREEASAMPFSEHLNDRPRNPALYGADEIPRFNEPSIRFELQEKIEASLARRFGRAHDQARAA